MLGENVGADDHIAHAGLPPVTAPHMAPEKPPEQAIEQVRELLFGTARRDSDKRIQELQDSIDALRADMMSLFADLEARMADGDAALERRHAVAAQGLGSVVAELGAQLLKLSVPGGK
ncbi:MAG: hypothetical protein JWN93_2199 [Hyphomicrobiales bacterium]|nr:hypothetical protein [Hyphomicrobiales bacterium]